MLTKHNTQDQYCTLLKIFTVFIHIVDVKVAFCAENQNISNGILYNRLHTVNTANTFVETNECIQQIKYSTLFHSLCSCRNVQITVATVSAEVGLNSLSSLSQCCPMVHNMVNQCCSNFIRYCKFGPILPRPPGVPLPTTLLPRAPPRSSSLYLFLSLPLFFHRLPPSHPHSPSSSSCNIAFHF